MSGDPNAPRLPERLTLCDIHVSCLMDEERRHRVVTTEGQGFDVTIIESEGLAAELVRRYNDFPIVVESNVECFIQQNALAAKLSDLERRHKELVAAAEAALARFKESDGACGDSRCECASEPIKMLRSALAAAKGA